MKNKSTLALLATALAFALPASFAAEAAALAVPAALDPRPVFGAFVATLVLLSVFREYGRNRIRFAHSTRAIPAAPVAPAKAEHPLAA